MREDSIDCTAGRKDPAKLNDLRHALAGQRLPLQRMAHHYALLGGETRLKILALLDRASELCVCDLASVLEITPAAVSQHLSRLRTGNLVRSRRDGMTIYYRLSQSASETVVSPKLELAGRPEESNEAVR